MSTSAEQAALGYFLAWLEAHQDEHGAIVRAFGAIRNEDGGIHSVRVKVFDTILSMRPMQPPPENVRAQASDIRPASVPAEVEGAMASRPNYGGAERYRCPSCGARQWDWCTTKTGTQSYRPHSAREHMVT
jgi:hypothetical protein